MMNRRRALMAAAQDTPILPSGYQQVDYLTTNGSAYFQVTKAVPLGYSVRTVAMQSANDSQYRVASGGGNEAVYIGYMCYPAGANKVGAFYGTQANAYPTMSSLYGLKTEVTAVFSSTGVTATAKNSSGTQTLTTAKTGMTQSNLFRVGYNGLTAPAFKGRIYDVEVRDTNSAPYIHYIPCYRKNDNVAGMYDIVNNAFYPSDTSTPFGWGND